MTHDATNGRVAESRQTRVALAETMLRCFRGAKIILPSVRGISSIRSSLAGL